MAQATSSQKSEDATQTNKTEEQGKLKNSPEQNFEEDNAQIIDTEKARLDKQTSGLIESIDEMKENEHYLFAQKEGDEKFVGQYVGKIGKHTIDLKPMNSGQYLTTRDFRFSSYTVTWVSREQAFDLSQPNAHAFHEE